MSSLEAKRSSLDSRRHRFAAAAVLCLSLSVGAVAGGCAKKEASAPSPTNAAAVGQPSADIAPGAAKPTPEQEAAKQRGLQQGPAIEAAMRASQGK
jgi:hypothetical protein